MSDNIVDTTTAQISEEDVKRCKKVFGGLIKSLKRNTVSETGAAMTNENIANVIGTSHSSIALACQGRMTLDTFVRILLTFERADLLDSFDLKSTSVRHGLPPKILERLESGQAINSVKDFEKCVEVFPDREFEVTHRIYISLKSAGFEIRAAFYEEEDKYYAKKATK
jgi:hypothetical protein